MHRGRACGGLGQEWSLESSLPGLSPCLTSPTCPMASLCSTLCTLLRQRASVFWFRNVPKAACRVPPLSSSDCFYKSLNYQVSLSSWSSDWIVNKSNFCICLPLPSCDDRQNRVKQEENNNNKVRSHQQEPHLVLSLGCILETTIIRSVFIQA